MANDRKKQNLEVLRNAVDKGRSGGNGAPGSGGGSGDGNQIMYRGKPVGRSGGRGGAPGAPGGAARAPKNQGQANDSGDVKEALRKLTQLFNDGLITTAEYDAKRAEILNRL